MQIQSLSQFTVSCKEQFTVRSNISARPYAPMYLSDSTVLLSLFYTYYVLYYCTPYMATAITANAATALPWRG